MSKSGSCNSLIDDCLSVTDAELEAEFASVCLDDKDKKKMKKKKKQRLRFRENKNRVYKIQHLHDMPEEQILAVWYNYDEYQNIRFEYKQTVKIMQQHGGRLPPPLKLQQIAEKQSSRRRIADDEAATEVVHEERGLEIRVRENALASRKRRADAATAVLEEQTRQWSEGCSWCDARLAAAYAPHSQGPALDAAMRGASDRQATKKTFRALLQSLNSSTTLSSSSSSSGRDGGRSAQMDASVSSRGSSCSSSGYSSSSDLTSYSSTFAASRYFRGRGQAPADEQQRRGHSRVNNGLSTSASLPSLLTPTAATLSCCVA